MTSGERIYNYSIKGVDGKEIRFRNFKGKKILIVNTASECGFKSQFALLQDIYEHFSDKLIIIAVPSNDFGNQEPGNDEEIASFCRKQFHISFPIATKTIVVGKNQHPLFQWLTSAERNNRMDVNMKWNFHKFLVDEEGILQAVFDPAVDPCSEEILDLLGA